MGYYLFAILPNINVLLTVLICMGAIAMLVAFVATADTDYAKDGFSFARFVLYIEVALGLVHTLLPSQKQMAFIIAAPYIVENQQLQEAGKNSAEIIKLGTDYLKEIVNEKVVDKTETKDVQTSVD